MVIYNLICKKKHRFEGWFPSFEGYQEQAAKGLISCPTCGTTKVEKMPHACAVLTHRSEKEEKKKKRQKEDPRRNPTEAEMKEFLIRLHHHVCENFEDVGPKFAEEARAIVSGRSKERPIHGTCTPKERQELDEEGIPYAILPKPELDS